MQEKGSLSDEPSTQRVPASRLIMNLRTDDGFLVSELTSQSRGNWAKELITTFSSRILARISFRLTIVMAWASYVTAVITAGDFIAPPEWGSLTQFEVPGWPHELIGGFLAILLVFRTDQSYDRFWEGRNHWAELTSQCRTIARMALTNIQNEDLASQVMALLAVFPVALKQHLRGELNEPEIKAVYFLYRPSSDTATIDRICQSKSIPTSALLQISQTLAPLRASRRESTILWEEFMERLDELSLIVSECEKLRCTPLPLSYSRHTSRFFSLFTLSLPFALVKETSPLLVPTVVTATAWVLFATDEIGKIIEDPFGYGFLEQTPFESTIVEKRRAANRQVAGERRQMYLEDVREAFEAIDTDMDGFINATELERWLPGVVGAEEVTDPYGLLTRLDLNGDESIDFEEFRLLWCLIIGGTSVQDREVLPLQKLVDSLTREMFFLHVSMRENEGSGAGELEPFLDSFRQYYSGGQAGPASSAGEEEEEDE